MAEVVAFSGSCGLDRRTGLPLYGFAHTTQCIDVIFSARQGDCVMLRWFGAGMIELLGRRATLRNVMLYRSLIALGINTWEPRFLVVGARASENTAAALTLGRLRYAAEGYYRPGALQGDYRVEGGLRRIALNGLGGRLSVEAAA